MLPKATTGFFCAGRETRTPTSVLSSQASKTCVYTISPSRHLVYYITMRKILPVFILLFFFVKPVSADYQKAYNDYSYNYSQYRGAYNDYQTAKSSYAAYQTLNSQANAINKLRAVLQTRDSLISSYYDLLFEKSAGKISLAQKDWLAEHQRKLAAAASLEDLNSAAAEFESRYPQMDTETKQAVGIILLAKEKVLTDQWAKLADDTSVKMKAIPDTGIGERGVIAARDKFALGIKKLTGLKWETLLSDQQKLSEANQYFREATDYLLEVVKSVTG